MWEFLWKNHECSQSKYYVVRQRLSLAIQKDNSQGIMGTTPTSQGLDEIYDFEDHNSDT